MSSSADAYCGGGGGGGEHHYQMYHVPQHSRREKLRFPPEESQTTPPLLFHDTNAAPPLFPTNYYPSSSTSPSPFYPHNPHMGFSPQPQFISAGHVPFPQMPHQGFSLSLSSSSPPPPPQPSSSSSSSRQQFGPFGPFTGYAAVLNRSRFLGPARELLEEICDVGWRPAVGGGDGSGDEGIGDADPVEAISSVDHGMDRARGGEEGGISGAECQWKKTRLVSMLEEVCKRYKHYYQQVQAVMASFESVAGLSTAAPFASLALKAMSKHFRFFKSIISSQLRQTHKFLGKEGANKEDFSNFGHISNAICVQKTNTGTFGQPHVWRPQRGLPERAVAVLRAWLFEHFLHPYPTDTDKQMLAKQTGLTRNQVSNWFINARVRLWKPMVEEIHSLEMRQLQKHSSADKNNDGSQQAHQTQDIGANPSGIRLPQAGNSDKNRNPTSKRFQNDLPQMPQPIQEPINFVYDGLSSHQHIGVGLGVSSGGNGGVSLTLGLHQNNRVSIAEPLPLNVVHRFGLEECNDAYVMGSFEGQGRMGSFEGQDRQFAKEIGSHLLHDFVG